MARARRGERVGVPALRVGSVELGGVSVGGIETCIDVPTYDLAFDVGRCPDAAVARRTILFTHAHMDHMGGVAWHAATRALQHLPPPTYVVPRENAEAFAELFEVWRRLDRSELPHRVVPLAPGDELALRKDLFARPFRSPHRVVCQGYALWQRREKLRPEYGGLPTEEIRRLRVELGRQVTEARLVPELAFTGDTTIEVVEREEVVRTARVLVMEVTFVDERVSVEECRAKGHVHLHEVAERAELFHNEALVLSHFSARYSAEDVLAALDRTLPAELRARVTALVVPPPGRSDGAAQ